MPGRLPLNVEIAWSLAMLRRKRGGGLRREAGKRTARPADSKIQAQPNAGDRHAAEIGNVENGSPVWGAYFIFSQSVVPIQPE